MQALAGFFMVCLQLGLTRNDQRGNNVGNQSRTGEQGYKDPRQTNQSRVDIKILSDTRADTVNLFVISGFIQFLFHYDHLKL